MKWVAESPRRRPGAGRKELESPRSLRFRPVYMPQRSLHDDADSTYCEVESCARSFVDGEAEEKWR